MNKGQEQAFTRIELLIVIAILGLLATTVAPALSRSQPNSKIIQCLNNLRQFTHAWSEFASDNNEVAPNNFGIEGIEGAILSKKFDNWANNVMTWGGSAGVYDTSNTNVNWLAKGPLGNYLAYTINVYKCPGDNFLSPQQLAARFKQRNRSISMNSLFGHSSSSPTDSTWSNPPLNWLYPQYLQYLKQSKVPKPAKTWLILDEQPDSINDGYFVVSPQQTSWGDIPPSFHNGACGFSFVDGHAEMRKWLSATSAYFVHYSYFPPSVFDALGRADFAWYLEHSGFLDASTGNLLFGY